METIIEKARAKINTALEVQGKKNNGYHALRMIMQTLRLHDSLFIKKGHTLPLTLVCNRSDLPTDQGNLAFRAADFLIRKYHITDGVFIYLKKRIPVAAGLGGGSSDAAAVLRGMNLLFDLRIPKERLLEIGLTLGADVPFCLTQGTLLAEGVGEILTPLPPHPAVWVVLAKPPVAVSTGEIFKRYNPATAGEKPDISAMLNALTSQNLPMIAAAFGNQLTGVTAGLHPEIYDLIRWMRHHGALNAAMSGSGPTVFGYYPDKEAAISAVCALKSAFPAMREILLTQVYNERRNP